MSNAVCMSCRKPKNGLRRRKSKLVVQDLLLCSACYEAKYEPRYSIILKARDLLRKGIDVDNPEFSAVIDCIKTRRYIGEEVTLRELL